MEKGSRYDIIGKSSVKRIRRFGTTGTTMS